jgi:hypothetical protein
MTARSGAAGRAEHVLGRSDICPNGLPFPRLEKQLLEKMGVEVAELDAGCCGMAGGWGYESGHYDVSVACAERVLLPKVREAATDTLVIAGGFSCRSQIEQGRTGRRALHAAPVLALARRYGPGGPPGPYPELAAPEPPQPGPLRSAARAAAVIGAAAALAAVGSLTYTRLR